MLNDEIKKYLKGKFFVDAKIDDEKRFWFELFDNDEDEFISMLETISPFKEDIRLFARLVVRIDDKDFSVLDDSWNMRESYLRKTLTISESKDYLDDKLIIQFIENLK